MEDGHVFKAVADDHRRQLLDSLATTGPQTLTQLCVSMPMSRVGVMKHLRILEQAGLITTRKVGRERLHYLNPAPLENVASWLDNYRRLWEDRMDRLEDLISRTQLDKQTKEQEDAEA